MNRYCNNADGDIDDAADDIQIDDDFASNVLNVMYDKNGNLTDDAVTQYTYDVATATRRGGMRAGR